MEGDARPFLPLLGLYVAGDLADWTLWTTKRGRIVWAPRSPPRQPPTAAQLKQRARFAVAQQTWAAISSTLKAAWEQAMITCDLDMTGQNAVMSLALNPDPDALASINKRTGLNLPMPTQVPY